VLSAVVAYQQADWVSYVELASVAGIDVGAGTTAYVAALDWTDRLLAA
jgi:hypothetical protein